MLPSSAKGPQAGERRAAERHACKPHLLCEVIDPLDQTVVPVGAWDVSATGVCVVVESHFAHGAHIEVAFRTPGHDDSVRRFAEVVHTVLVPSRREMWLTGCAFSEGLKEGDLGPEG
jgi:hypothetical protein